METNQSNWEKVKGFVSRNKKKVIIAVSSIGAAIIGSGILMKVVNADGSYDYIEEEIELETNETQDDSNEE